MKKCGAFLLLLIIFSITLQNNSAKAQNIELPQSLFRMAEGFVRIAEPGVFADTVSVFGDINAPGRYILPRRTNIHELLGYARGPIQQRSSGQRADWGKIRLEITVSKLNQSTGRRNLERFKFKYDENYPEGFTDMVIGNDDIISVEVRRRPAFIDYLRVFSTIAAATATSILVVDRLSE